MAGSLFSNIFLSAQDLFKKRCCNLFLEAYNSSINDNVISIDFDENDISSILHNYIYKNPYRIKWGIVSGVESHLFDNSRTTFTKGFAAKQSRIDFKFGKIWSGNEYEYFVEAKNLKANNSALKRRYITTGIDNFLIGGKYHDCEGFLVGYILQGKVIECVDGINKLLKSDGRNTEILNANIVYGFDSLLSLHSIRNLDHFFLNYT